MLINRDHLTLRTNLVWVDVNDVMRATTSQPAPLSLLEGDLLEDLDGVDPAFDSWLAAERERLRDRARKLAEDLLGEQTDPETTIPAAQRLLAIDRAHEGAWRAMMRAYAARGERGMAIQAYERCRAVLADLLDAAPSSETQRLLTEIRGPGSRIMPRRPASPEPSPAPTAEPSPPGGSAIAALTASPPAVASLADVLADPVAPERPAGEKPVPERPAAEPPQTGSFARSGPRIGVLPLQLMGATEDESLLSIGLADEITTALARFRSLFVVSSTSIARFAEASRDEGAIQRMFGLDFLLDGTGQRVRNRLRITLRLLDLRAGNQVVWTGRFDRQTHDLLNLQDEVAAETVAQIDAVVLQIEAARATARPLTLDTDVYDLTLRALPLGSRMDRASFLQAGELLARAVLQGPDYAAAHAAYALWQLLLVGQDWATNPRDHAERASELAERAIMLDPQDARALTIAGHVRTELTHRLREGAALHERALSINPNQAMAWGLSGITQAYLGEIEEAERRLNRYKRLLPMSRYAFMYDTGFVMVALMKRDYETAVSIGREVTEMNPLHSAGLKPYLAALGYLGRGSDAAVVLRKLAAIEPDFSVQRFLARAPFARMQDRDHYANGLRLAGVPALDAQLAGY
jgi:TolB-like protein